MKSCSQEPQTIDRGSELQEGFLYLGEPIESPAKPTKCMQPRDGPLDEPAIGSQPAAVLRAAGGQDGSDSHPTQDLSKRFGVVAAIALQPLGILALGAMLNGDRRPA